MELKKVESKKNMLRVEVVGEDHSLLNLLRDECCKAGASSASYQLDHPLIGNPILTVVASKPKEVLKKAAASIGKQSKQFQTKLKA